MPLDLPAPAPIDRSRAGVLTISAGVLGRLLRLPEGLEIVAVRPMADCDAVELLIEGDPLPPCKADAQPEAVTLILHTKLDPDTQLVSVTANFAHAPDVSWTLAFPHPYEGFKPT
jgi:hypothetical protein